MVSRAGFQQDNEVLADCTVPSAISVSEKASLKSLILFEEVVRFAGIHMYTVPMVNCWLENDHSFAYEFERLGSTTKSISSQLSGPNAGSPIEA